MTRIKEILEKSGIKQKELAEKTGMSEQAISNYVNGRVTPKPWTLAQIAAALDTSTESLVDDDSVVHRKWTLQSFSKYIGKSPEFVADWVKSGNCPCGYYAKTKRGKSSYVFYPAKIAEYFGGATT